jgi:hypothetical protein
VSANDPTTAARIFMPKDELAESIVPKENLKVIRQ